MVRLKQLWSSIMVLAIVVIGAGAVPITYLESAVAKGAGTQFFIFIFASNMLIKG